MANKLYEAIDRAPFSGKFLIGNSLLRYHTIGDKGKNRQFLKTATLMTGMAAVHAYQAKIGIDTFSSHMEQFMDSPDGVEAAWLGVDATYAAAMGSVAVRQVDHLARITKKHARWVKTTFADKGERSERVPRSRSYKIGSVILAATVTLGGQIAEGVSAYHAYEARNVAEENKLKEKCIVDSFTNLNKIGPYTIQVQDGKRYDIKDIGSAVQFCTDIL